MISKKEAFTAYVLYLMMWDELSDPKVYELWGKEAPYKDRTVAYTLNHAENCEFCGIAKKIGITSAPNGRWNCSTCPSKIKTGLHSRDYKFYCLGGVFDEWRNALSPLTKAKLAEQIRDIELADWFKELIK